MFEHLVGRVEGAHLGALRPHEGGQVDEPQAVAVAQQAFRPHVWHGRVLLSPLLGQLDLLNGEGRWAFVTTEGGELAGKCY